MARTKTARPTKVKTITVAGQSTTGPVARANRRQIRVFYLPAMQQPATIAADSNAQLTRRPRRKPSTNLHDLEVKELRNSFKLRYVQPDIDQIPYNKNMARKFASTENQTAEEQAKRNRQAIASRVSRDRTKFVDECVRMEHEQLENELLGCIQELQQATDRVDAERKMKRLPSVDWAAMWKD